MAAAGLPFEMVTFPAGEPNKSLAQAERFWEACAAMRLDRKGAIIALGGGVCGDLAGFTAGLDARHPFCADPNHPAVHGRFVGRRQDGGE